MVPMLAEAIGGLAGRLEGGTLVMLSNGSRAIPTLEEV
jgi:hypothetical protein